MSLDGDIKQVSALSPADRSRVAALLVVRYCGFHGDPHFSPWFETHRDALAKVRELAVDICRQALPGVAEVTREALEVVRELLDEVIEGSDPDGPPFETEVVDHLVFATEVLDFLLSPQETGALSYAFERALELAEARREMGEEDYPDNAWEPVDFEALEAAARHADIGELLAAEQEGILDPAPTLARSEEFARRYADVIAHCYTDEEAGQQG
ncbi:hypothetical protein ACWCQN_05640 [Streptomyces sp. NPDC001984]